MRVLLRFFGNLLRLLIAPLWLLSRARARATPRWVVLHLAPRITPFRSRETWLQRLLAARSPEQLRSSSLEELRALGSLLARDRRAPGLLVYLPPLDAGWAACESLRDVFLRVRAAGKQVVCYLPEGGGNRELYVASACDRMYLGPYAALGPLGLASAPLYLRPLLDRIGVRVEAQACGEYKSAAEPALRDTMSEPAREQLVALLAAMHASLRDSLQKRGLGAEQVEALLARGLVPASAAQGAGLIDGIAYEDELAARLGIDAPAGAKRKGRGKFIRAANYVRLRSARLWRPLRQKPCIAVLSLRGTITGEGGFGRTSMHKGPVSAALRALARDDRARAVVLYIDSPGGSALASELMHREIVRLAKRKPVVACFGDVAASGGYYLACACNKIVAQPLAITGSIGVISAKIAAGSLLERLGVRPQPVRTAPSADMLSFTRPLSADEDAMLRAHAGELYTRFLSVVAEGRGRPVGEIEPLARGRVWIGRDAQARGLVDVLGDFDRALDEARALLPGLTAEAREALEARVYPVKASETPSVPELASAAFGSPQLGFSALCARELASLLLGALPDLSFLQIARREPALYYAPFASGLE